MDPSIRWGGYPIWAIAQNAPLSLCRAFNAQPPSPVMVVAGGWLGIKSQVFCGGVVGHHHFPNVIAIAIVMFI